MKIAYVRIQLIHEIFHIQIRESPILLQKNRPMIFLYEIKSLVIENIGNTSLKKSKNQYYEAYLL